MFNISANQKTKLPMAATVLQDHDQMRNIYGGLHIHYLY